MLPKNDRMVAELLESMRSMHKHGFVTKADMREFEALCGEVPSYGAEEVKGLRFRFKLSQSVLARLLNASASAVRAWEAGTKKPSGPSCKLLNVLERKGIEALT